MSRRAGIFTFTACALQASAFLLPPNVALASEDDAAPALGLTGLVTPNNAVVQLPCSECVFSAPKAAEEVENVEDEPLFWIQGGAHSVVVNFTVSDDRHRLLVNGETIYPLGLLEADMFGSPKVYVDQVRSGASVADIEEGVEKTTPVEVTGHSIGFNQQGDDVLITIEYTVYEIERQPVSLDVITVDVLDLPEGLMIVSAVSQAPKASRPEDFFGPPPEDFLFPPPPSELEEPEMGKPQFGRQKECKMLPAALCKLRNIIASKLSGMGKVGGCQGQKGVRPHGGKLPSHIRPHHGRPHSDDEEPPHHRGHHSRPEMDDEELPPHRGHHSGPEMDDEEPRHHRGHGFRPEMDDGEPRHHRGHRFRPEADDDEQPHRPHHGRPHRAHHHSHHTHHFMHAFSRGLAAVLVPTMAGIAVGMTASLVGLIAGRLVGFLWIRLYRGGRRGYASVTLDETSVNEMVSEKEVVEEESLPVYELAPAYEEVSKETK